MTIRTKVLGGYLLLALLLAAISLYALEMSKAALVEAAGRDTISIARKTLSRMEQNLSHRTEEVKLLCQGDTLVRAVETSNARVALDPDSLQLAVPHGDSHTDQNTTFPALATASRVDGFSEKLQRIFIRFFEVEYGQQYYQRVTVYNRFGFLVGEAGDIKASLHEGNAGVWNDAVKEGVHICMDTTAAEGEYIHTILITARISDQNGEFIGMVKALVPIISIIRPAEIITQGYRTTTIRLMDASGHLLYSSFAFPIGTNLSAEPFYHQMQGAQGYFSSRSSAGKETLLGYVKTKDDGLDKNLSWVLALEHESREVMGGVGRLEKDIYLAIVLAMSLVGVMLFVMNRSVTKPLSVLSDGANMVAQGELGHQIPFGSADEIGTVAAAFNQMSVKLAANYNELQEENRKRREAQEEVASKAELLERQNQELARKNEDLDEFTYVASHDLQEPLRKITAFSNLLVQDLGGNLPVQAATDLGFMTDAAKRMQVLIHDLLAFSRSGRVAMARDLIPLDHCVEQALEMLSTRLEESGAKIVRDPLPVVHGDPALLAQLYQNLIGNALKFHRPGERPLIELTSDEEGKDVILGVKDNGIGFKQEYGEQIFQTFKRLHGREEYEGSGIGLAICRKIVERHNGRIWVESAPGAGAHFRFSLPKK